jgi:hypothetical protein
LGLGVREKAHRTGPIIFSAPRPVGRQFAAMWIGGVLVTLLTGSGVGPRLLTNDAWDHLLGWGVTVLFIPTLALALGVWCIGPINRLAIFDYMGLSREAIAKGMSPIYLGLIAALLAAALVARRRQIQG